MKNPSDVFTADTSSDYVQDPILFQRPHKRQIMIQGRVIHKLEVHHGINKNTS